MRTEDRLIEAARAVFLRHGYQGASMDLVAREAELSRATLYNHFENRDALFAACLEKLLADAGADVAAADASTLRATAIDRVTTLLVAWEGAFSKALGTSPYAAELTAIAMQHWADAMQTARAGFERLLVATLIDCQAQGTLATVRGLPAQTLAEALLMASHGAKSSEPKPDADELAKRVRRLVVLILGGVSAMASNAQ